MVDLKLWQSENKEGAIKTLKEKKSCGGREYDILMTVRNLRMKSIS